MLVLVEGWSWISRIRVGSLLRVHNGLLEVFAASSKAMRLLALLKSVRTRKAGDGLVRVEQRRDRV